MTVASRYNLRAWAGDGRLILWNTLTRSVSVFRRDQAASVARLLRGTQRMDGEAGLESYLHARGFLVADRDMEWARVQREYGRRHYRSDVLELILLASEDCNFRCTYCYETFERGTMLPAVREGVKMLVLGRLPALVRLNVSWFGGEPLHGMSAIEDLAPFFHDLSTAHGLHVASHMTTNGFLLTDEVAGQLLGWGIRDFQITLDGLADDHDLKRPTRDGEPTFRTIFENLVALHRRSDELSVRIRVNFDKANAERLGALLDLLSVALEKDPRFEVAFHAVGRWGGANDDRLAACSSEESPVLVRHWRRAARARGLRVAGALAEINRSGGQVCYAARPYSFIVGADGRLMKCTVALDRLEANRVGRLEGGGELVVDEHRLALWTQPFFEGDDACRRCVLLPTCQGSHCPLRRLESDGRACPPTRTSFKSDLVDAVANPTGCERRVNITTD